MAYTDQELEAMARELWNQKRSDSLFNLHSTQGLTEQPDMWENKGRSRMPISQHIDQSLRTLTDEDYLKKCTPYNEESWAAFLNSIMTSPQPEEALKFAGIVHSGAGSDMAREKTIKPVKPVVAKPSISPDILSALSQMRM